MNLNLTDILTKSSKKYGKKTAYSMQMGFRAKHFSFEDIEKLAKKTALMLQENGVKKNDNVIFLIPNSPYWIISFWACVLIGARPVPINIQMQEEQIKKIVKQTEAKLILINKILDIKFNFEEIPTILIEKIEDLANQYNEKDFKKIEINPDDIVQIMYTSGTTGDPKGVILTHKNIASNMLSVSELINVNLEKDKLLSILPLSHIFEQTVGFLLPFNKGIHVVFTHSHSAISELLINYQITKMGAVPEFLQIFMSRIENSIKQSFVFNKVFKFLTTLTNKINSQKFSRFIFYPVLKKMGKLNTIASGGAYLDPKLEQKWNNLGIMILQGYGLTETSPCVTTNTFDCHKIGSVGKVIPGVKIKLSSDNEILVKGPNVFPGYYKNKEKTEEAFTQDGWFKTGDIGEFDKDGFLFIKGRKKYMILSSGGQNVYPEDIEIILNEQSGVQDSCVVGIEKDSGRVEIHAVILKNPDEEINLEKIIENTNQKLASYQQINNFSMWPELDFPRTAIRKIKRNDVIDWIKLKKIDPNTKEKPNSKLELILSKITGVDVNKINSNTKLIQELHIDSLMRVEIVMWIEQEFAIEISESEINPNTTVENLAEIIKNKKSNPIKKEKLKKWPRWKFINFLRLILQYPFFWVFKIFVKLEVKNKSGINLKKLKLPVIVMPNHVSYVDAVIINMALPIKIRKTLAYTAARDQLYGKYKHIAWLGELLFNAFPISRSDQQNIKQGLEFMGKMLDKNYSIVIFPEGHISKDEKLQTLKPGTGIIATQMETPILPVKISGLQKIFPFGKMIPRTREKVTVEILPPLKFNTLDNPDKAAEKIYNEMKIN